MQNPRCFPLEERVKMLEEVSEKIYQNVKVVPFEGLLVEFAKRYERQDDCRPGTCGRSQILSMSFRWHRQTRSWPVNVGD